jgi:acyl-CoA thioesterase
VTESSLLATTNVYGGAVIALSLGALALTAARRRTTLVMSA